MKNIGRKHFWLVALLVAAAGLPATITQGAWPDSVLGPIVAGGKKPGPAYVPDELLVKFKSGVAVQARARSISAMGVRASHSLNQSGLMRLKLPGGISMAQAASLYAADPNVEYVQPNYIYRIAAAPNDPLYGELWAFKNTGQIVTGATYMSTNGGTPGRDMNIEPAWDHVTDCKSVVVAVLDTGVNYDQEDLAASMWNGGTSFPNHGDDFIDNDADPMDLNGHGTHVAGVIGAAGNNSVGATGVCWQASIMALRVLDAAGAGTSATVIQGINFAVANGAKVINMSVGGNGGPDQGLNAAISNAQANDVVVAVAAGNDGANNDISGNAVFPCNFTHANIVCVAALDQNFALASFSNWGATSVDVGAPGTDIRSTWAGTVARITDDFNNGGTLDWKTVETPTGGWAYRQGTVSTGGTVDVLANPSTFPTMGSTYVDNANQRVYKEFDLSGSDAALLNFFAQIALEPNDSVSVSYRSSGGDPFVDGVSLGSLPDNTNGFVAGPFSSDISPCISATCSIGFRLSSNPSGVDQGIGILFFSIDTLQLNTNSYQTITGTSMATPQVAGLAAMLRAYNPRYTYLETVNAIKNGGRAVAALAGKTTSGRAVDAMGSLAYINPPTGLTANVQ